MFYPAINIGLDGQSFNISGSPVSPVSEAFVNSCRKTKIGYQFHLIAPGLQRFDWFNL
jgi:hypothetical protein